MPVVNRRGYILSFTPLLFHSRNNSKLRISTSYLSSYFLINLDSVSFRSQRSRLSVRRDISGRIGVIHTFTREARQVRETKSARCKLDFLPCVHCWYGGFGASVLRRKRIAYFNTWPFRAGRFRYETCGFRRMYNIEYAPRHIDQSVRTGLSRAPVGSTQQHYSRFTFKPGSRGQRLAKYFISVYFAFFRNSVAFLVCRWTKKKKELMCFEEFASDKLIVNVSRD